MYLCGGNYALGTGCLNCTDCLGENRDGHISSVGNNFELLKVDPEIINRLNKLPRRRNKCQQ